jgi:hypothetical protein
MYSPSYSAQPSMIQLNKKNSVVVTVIKITMQQQTSNESGGPVVEATISDCDDDEFSAASVDESDESGLLQVAVTVYSPEKKKKKAKSIIRKWTVLCKNASQLFIKAIKRDYPHVKKGGWSTPPYRAKRAECGEDVMSRYVRFCVHDPSSDDSEEEEGVGGTEILILKLRNGTTTVSSRPLLKVPLRSKSSALLVEIDFRFQDKLDELIKGTLFAAHLFLLHGTNTNTNYHFICYSYCDTGF